MSTTNPQHSDRLDEDALTARVLDIDGVTDIYPPATVLAQLPHAITDLATGIPPFRNRVSILQDQYHTALSVRIGVDFRSAAPETATRVAETLLSALAPSEGGTVTVQVSRIAHHP